MANEDYEECEECGTVGEVVQYRADIGYLGAYLCDMCYVNEKILGRD